MFVLLMCSSILTHRNIIWKLDLNKIISENDHLEVALKPKTKSGQKFGTLSKPTRLILWSKFICQVSKAPQRTGLNDVFNIIQTNSAFYQTRSSKMKSLFPLFLSFLDFVKISISTDHMKKIASIKIGLTTENTKPKGRKCLIMQTKHMVWIKLKVIVPKMCLLSFW